ncbi:MAG: sn-glycerol-3-phosphate ABC transporter ATP-binding protein UgpC [Ramlibacter sp.]|uniref:ABC transporter ATP-binding protein n=1 Tax=Ramlibacter sp. TaxID=1917967 RepID=UPI00262ADD4B|nr:sn-glycerol-3-phosphate ABC transporter ATP-binding protein UgpC [Ramlibacter sp.]MDH4377589.1 sn-glycerol-3-phosphate ABC transporter ATP-binding protein UgpC [Ramlibacter sp.]
MSTLELRSVTKRFQQVDVIRGVDLQVRHGEFVVFVGPSGCGKSTLLRLIAGLETASGGDILIDDQRVNDIGAADRGCAMVFQSYALYPHMTVRANMAFGLENAKVARQEINRLVGEAATLLRLDPLLDRKPTQLSGGQRQRVAIGRAIVRDPKIFLFDEPLSNLDAELRVSMRAELRELHQRLGATMVYVTHDQVEAMTMADRIVVLRDGRIEQVGTPQALYERPCNTFVAGFIGSPRMNFIPASHAAALGRAGSGPSQASQLGVRPEHLHLAPQGQGLALTLRAAEYMGANSLVQGDLADGTRIETLIEGPAPGIGQTLWLQADVHHIHAFDAQGLRLENLA